MEPRQPSAAEVRATAEAKARAAGRADALAHYRDLTALCNIAHRPELVGDFLAARTPLSAVRGTLIDAMCDAQDQDEISSQIAPEGTEQEQFAAMWDRAVEKANGRPNP